METVIEDRCAQHYDAYPFPGKLNAYGPWTDLAPNLLEALGIPSIAVRDSLILDAGCGTGEYARSFARLGGHVTGVDVSRRALMTAEAIDRELGSPPVVYRHANFLELPDGQRFDIILSLGVLHHTPDPAHGFRSLVRRLRPGGYLLVGLYSSISRAHILALRRLLHILGRGNQEKAIDLAQSWCRPFARLCVGGANVDDRARIADLLANPREKPVSLHTALGWFAAAGLEVIQSTPSCDVSKYPAPVRRASSVDVRLAYFLMQIQWLVWNADYYVVAGRAPVSA